MNEYEKMYAGASGNVSTYLENPINAYVLVKRLTADLKDVESLMAQNASLGIKFQLSIIPW